MEISNYALTHTSTRKTTAYRPAAGQTAAQPGETVSLSRDASHQVTSRPETVALQGSDFATPMVSGAVAVLLSKEPDLTPAEVKERLQSAKTENGTLNIAILLESDSDKASAQSETVLFHGSDLATPVVSAAIATLLSKEPDLTPAEVKERLRSSRTENGALNLAKLLGLE